MHRRLLNEVFGLDQTLKMHVIKYHNVIYFKMMGQTLREVSDKYHERVHYTHKNHEIKSVFFLKESTGQCLFKTFFNTFFYSRVKHKRIWMYKFIVTLVTLIWLFSSVLSLCLLKAPKLVHAPLHTLHVNSYMNHQIVALVY